MIKIYIRARIRCRVCVDTLSAMLTQSGEGRTEGVDDGGGLKRGGGRRWDEMRKWGVGQEEGKGGWN